MHGLELILCQEDYRSIQVSHIYEPFGRFSCTFMTFAFRDVAGIATVFDMTTAMKGVSLKPVDFGLALAKQGYQFGVTGTIPNVAAPSVTNTKFRVGYAGCSHFNVRFP